MNEVESFHYPPELFELMVEAIAVLSKAKQGVILFCRGAGISETVYKDLSIKLKTDNTSIGKHEIARTILTRINESKDAYIRERRELLKRVVEFESFTTCWPNDQYKAKGLVADIRNVVNVKDSFTRMKQEKEKEQKKNAIAYNEMIKELQVRNEKIEIIKRDFFSLFGNVNPQERGKTLEIVLNKLFELHNILIREAFTRRGDNGEGVIEQIDGVIEIDNDIYLVEMKWKKDKISIDDIYSHLGRIYHRAATHGIYISASGYSDASIIAAREALIKNAILILCELDEFVNVLNNNKDLKTFFTSKIKSAIIDKKPFTKP